MMKVNFTIFLFILPVFLLFCSKREEVEKRDERVETASWPIFRGDARLSGIAEDELPEKLSLIWSFQTEYEIISSPIIGLGRVYIGSTDHKIYALDLSDGTKDWEFDTGDYVEASPLLIDQTVYIGSLSGSFFALEAHTGQERWKYDIQFEIYGSANWVELENHHEKWILVGSYDAKLYCFNAITGRVNWTYETENFINGSPATDGKQVVFGGCDEYLHIVSVSDGAKLGEVWTGSYIPGSAALVDGRAYVGHYDNQMVCIDVIDQKIIWKYEAKDRGGPFFSSPAVGRDRILIGSRDGFLHCVDRETGRKIWTFRTRDEVDSSPVIVGDRIVFGSIDGRLYIVSLDNGKEIWSYEIGSAIIGCPAVAGGMIVIGAEDGRVYAFGDDS